MKTRIIQEVDVHKPDMIHTLYMFREINRQIRINRLVHNCSLKNKFVNRDFYLSGAAINVQFQHQQFLFASQIIRLSPKHMPTHSISMPVALYSGFIKSRFRVQYFRFGRVAI